MYLIISICVFLIACLHIYFFLLEAYFWSKPLGRKVFKLDPTFAKQSAMLALNQGLYNLFLSAGLFWSLLTPNMYFAFSLKLFFLACVTIAGIVGGISVNKRIFFIQGIPAIITLLLMGLK